MHADSLRTRLSTQTCRSQRLFKIDAGFVPLSHVPPPRTRPLPWLANCWHPVDAFFTLGHQAVQAAMTHLSTACGTGEFENEVYNRLIPHQYLWLPRGPADTPATPLLTWQELMAVPVLEPSARPVAWMSPTDLQAWMQTQLADELTDENFDSLFQEPARLVQLGTKLLRQFDDVWEDNGTLGACLAMVGAGALSILYSPLCDLCRYRRAPLITRRCGSCGRSKRLFDECPSGPAARASRARALRAVVRTPNAGNSEPEDVEGHFIRSMACILYGLPDDSPSHKTWAAAVGASLGKSPRVETVLPANFSELPFREQLSSLQSAVDRNEWDPAAFAEKIVMANAWLEAAAELQSRRRGPGPTDSTLQRAASAEVLLKEGKTKSEVAKALGISRSHLAHLLRRARKA